MSLFINVLFRRYHFMKIFHSSPPSIEQPLIPANLDERQKQLVQKCIKLMCGETLTAPLTTSAITTPMSPTGDENSNMSISQYSICSASTPSLSECSEWPARAKYEKVQYFIPDLEEICLSSMITRKGYLNVLEHGCSGWKKRWIVVRRPYIFVYKSEKDCIERAVLNLTNAQVECNEDQMAMIKIPNTFRLVL